MMRVLELNASDGVNPTILIQFGSLRLFTTTPEPEGREAQGRGHINSASARDIIQVKPYFWYYCACSARATRAR